MWRQREMSAVILAGGAGQRLGCPKAAMEFRPGETLLARKVSQLRPHFERIIIVANQSVHDAQPYPDMDTLTDHSDYQGPLVALGPVFQSYADRTEKLFITGCDFPFFHPKSIRLLDENLSNNDLALFNHEAHLIPLAAIYRTRLSGHLNDLVASGERRLMRFIDTCSRSILPSVALQTFDPEFTSLLNVNTPDDLATARALDNADL
jgi:molybdopterin-guanine dinucleotide biosynthesis protein A